MRQHTYSYKFLVLLLFACAATAQSRAPYYIAPAEVALDKVLAPPPAANTQAYKDDLQVVLDLQRSRSAAEVKDAQADAELSPFRFADVLGPQFNAEKVPFTVQFLRQALTDVGLSSGAAKAHFNRPRPYVASSEVLSVLGKPLNSPSYPSGHAMYGHSIGILLSIMVPEKSAELFERATRYGRNRVVGGVHYPTDVDAGRTAAAVVVNAMLHNQKFLADFERSRTEVRNALGLKN